MEIGGELAVSCGMDPADADAMAVATADAMKELQAQAQALSKFAPQILKSFLEGAR